MAPRSVKSFYLCKACQIFFVKRQRVLLIFFAVLLMVFFGLELTVGSVSLSWRELWHAVDGTYGPGQVAYEILWHYRLPKALAALWAGAALGLAGLLMQNLFRNPITGPYILGISSGAGLAVAVWLLGAGAAAVFSSPVALSVVAAAGGLAVLLFDLWLYRHTRQTVSLLVAGMMVGAFAGALLSLLTFFAPARDLQKYVFWTLGHLGDMTRSQILLLAVTVAVVAGMAWSKRWLLDGHLLGEKYVASAGYSVDKLHRFMIIGAGVLTGVVTAFAGPIAFVGLMVPHAVYMTGRTRRHAFTIPAVLLVGGIIMLAADWIAQWPGHEGVLPLNSITSLVGAPMVIWLLLRQK